MVTSLNYPLGGASRHCLYHTSVLLTIVLLLTRCTTGLHHQGGGSKSYSHQRISHHQQQQQSAKSDPTGLPGASTSADGLARKSDRGDVPRYAHDPQADSSAVQQGNFQGGFVNSTLDGPQPLCQEGKGGCNYGAGLDMKAISLEKIKQDILRKLKLDETRLPNISSKTSPIAEYLSEVMEMPRDMPPTETFDDDEAAEQTIIAFSKIQPLKLSPKESQDLYYFSFSDGKLVNMRVESAVLYIQVNITPSTPVQYPGMHFRAHPMEKKFTNFTIRITQHIPQKKNESPVQIDYGYFKPVFRPSDDVTEAPMKYDGTRWIMVDVREEILKWIAAAPGSSAKKVGLLIEAISPDDEISKDVKIVGSDDPDALSAASVNHNPFFKLNLKEKPKTRHARDVSMVCDESSAETRCCRYPLTVDFEEFGWDFIIAPKRYDAYYCSGECPPAFLQTYPHNHIVQQALPSGVGGPCCAARKLSPISMLYFDADMTIIYSTLPGMIVDRCGCT